VARSPQLSTEHPEASEPYSHDDAEGNQEARKDEDIEKQLVQKQSLIDRNLLIQREICVVVDPRQDPLGCVQIGGLDHHPYQWAAPNSSSRSRAMLGVG